MSIRTYPGLPYPLGATWDGSGVNFSLFSEHAEAVELCLFDEAHGPEVARVKVREQTDFAWHVYLPDARPGQLYGYRVYGPHDPANGHRFNSNKLLLDPYAKAITGGIEWSDAMFGYPLDGGDDRDLKMDEQDSAAGMPKGVVIEPAFSWGDDKLPKTPWNETIIYEAHVRGLTKLHPEIPEPARGTYAGLADYHTIRYLQDLGITAVELMPVQHFVHDRHLVDNGLRNYWGYNTIGFFAPDPRYARAKSPGAQVNEFKTMVKTLHQAGMEVILDVVYNHTGEGNHFGPTLSFRGIDNKAYYRLVGGDERYYMDYTGTGNTLSMLHPRTIQLIMDSLRYWVLEMHVDGFRFDLAATLARELHEVDRLSSFFDIIHQDPVLSQVKLIAEPWDLGEGGYQVGNFPVLWAEWNGKYRDNMRRFWKGNENELSELGYRLTGSSDLYASNGRRPYASVNFVTAHDGFTLRDLVSYNEKHNEANGENGNDGTNDNDSWNHGVEGETDDHGIKELRSRQMRNFLATLMLSQGVPMLLHGDEVARTQRGNNNVYAQDNETSWQSWDLDDMQKSQLAWTQRAIAFRKNHPTLRRRDYFQGQRIQGTQAKDLRWIRPDGREMNDEDWRNPVAKAIGMQTSGYASDLVDSRGKPIVDDSMLVLFNASDQPISFSVPRPQGSRRWTVAMDSSRPSDVESVKVGATYKLEARALAVLTNPTPADPRIRPDEDADAPPTNRVAPRQLSESKA